MKIENLTNQILDFACKINQFAFRPYQRKKAFELVKSIILNEGHVWTSLWARKSGKSETLKAVSLSLMCLLPSLSRSSAVKDFPNLKLFSDGFNVAISGPKMDTARIPFIRLKRQARAKQFLQSLQDELKLGIEVSNSVQFELSNGSTAEAFSGSEVASNEGPGAHLLIIDEATMIKPFAFYKILRPMVAATNGTISEWGTPGRRRCPFLADINRNKKAEPFLHQETDYLKVIEESETQWYAKYVEKEIDRLPGGEDNPFFRMNFILTWLIEESLYVDSDIFLNLDKCKRGVTTGGRLSAGVDWGKIVSSTTATILEERGNRFDVVDLLTVKGEWDEQFSYLIPFLKSYPLNIINTEAVGSGDPLSSRLKSELGGIVVPTFMSAQYKDKIFTNLKMVITSIPSRFGYFENGKVSKNFVQQFLDAEQDIRGDLLVVHKSDEEGATDDFLFSTALALDGLLSGRVSRIEHRGTGVKRSSLEELRSF